MKCTDFRDVTFILSIVSASLKQELIRVRHCPSSSSPEQFKTHIVTLTAIMQRSPDNGDFCHFCGLTMKRRQSRWFSASKTESCNHLPIRSRSILIGYLHPALQCQTHTHLCTYTQKHTQTHTPLCVYTQKHRGTHTHTSKYRPYYKKAWQKTQMMHFKFSSIYHHKDVTKIS